MPGDAPAVKIARTREYGAEVVLTGAEDGMAGAVEQAERIHIVAVLGEVEGDLELPRLPVVPGHQVIGRVARVGVGVGDWAVGERAAAAALEKVGGKDQAPCLVMDGEALYEAMIRHMTDSDRSPDEVHQTGLDEVAHGIISGRRPIGPTVMGRERSRCVTPA